MEATLLLIEAGANLEETMARPSADARVHCAPTRLRFAGKSIYCVNALWPPLLSSPAQMESATALNIAAESGEAACVRCLLEAGSDFGVRDISGYTPLMAVCIEALSASPASRRHGRLVSCIELLMEKGADKEAASLVRPAEPSLRGSCAAPAWVMQVHETRAESACDAFDMCPPP